jgi:hypothetical protein
MLSQQAPAFAAKNSPKSERGKRNEKEARINERQFSIVSFSL